MGKTTNKKDVELNIVYRNIKELKPYKKNAKKHPKEQVERIAFAGNYGVTLKKGKSVIR